MAGTDRRSEERKNAEKLYLESNGQIVLAELANKLNVSASKIRKWKTLDKWDQKLTGHTQSDEKSKKKPVERSTKKSSNKGTEKKVERSTSPSKKRGGQPGNKNAKGHGAKKGNKNAVNDRGAFARIYGSCFTEEEMAMVEAMSDNTEMVLMDQIKTLTIRETRIIKRLNQYYTDENKITLDDTIRTESKRTFDGTEEEQEEARQKYNDMIAAAVDKGDRMPGRQYTTTTKTTNKDNYIARLEHELTTVQLAKERSIQDLMNYRLEKQKLEGNGQSDAVKAWAESLMKEWGETDGN